MTDKASGSATAVLLLVLSLAEAHALASHAIRTLQPDWLLWVAYAKGSAEAKTDLNRDRLNAAPEPTGWRAVRLAALDDVWSAMRFRSGAQVGR